MVIDTFILLLAAAQLAPGPAGDQARGRIALVAGPVVTTDTYNAFVAVEETPAVAKLVRPAVLVRRGRDRAIACPPGTNPII